LVASRLTTRLLTLAGSGLPTHAASGSVAKVPDSRARRITSRLTTGSIGSTLPTPAMGMAPTSPGLLEHEPITASGHPSRRDLAKGEEE
jgi:hypothetical protein